MFNLTSTSDLLRVVTSAAAQIEVHCSWADVVNATSAVTLGGEPVAHITTATTTTIVPAPALGSSRNVKHINITNDHPSASCKVEVEMTDGTTVIELMGFILLPGENMIMNEEGRWAHRDAQGAEYPPAGLGAYGGYNIALYKTGTAAEAVGTFYATAKDGGFPGAWSPGTPGINGRVTDGTLASDNGCMLIRNPTTGANYLTKARITSSVAHSSYWMDVLWVNSGLVVTTTTAQAIVSPTLPARDIDGTTNGAGCQIGLLFTAAATNAAVNSTMTVNYTNSDGTTGRTARLTAIVGSQVPATPVIGTVVWFNLDAGDRGVRSIQGITLATSLVTGSVSLFIARDLASVGTVQPSIEAREDYGSGVRLFNGTCGLHYYLASAVTATLFSGELTIQEK
jgi:hypothetical protein